ncbi:MAG TPA: SOS response-associated peptidase [Bacteroidales bacterium]|nr:SOS response-associated peptidase [Bacteroidales bacterium]
MCGRYSFAVEDELIKERFGVSVRSAVWKARYNCAPTQDLAVISTSDPLTLSMYRWGLIPSWAKDPGMSAAMINARAETILEKASFKVPFRHRRCLVPADGFYEWKQTVRGKAPHRVILKGGAPFAMAGIWDQWVSPDGEIICSFSIITTTPNELMKEIHDRMPVILPREHEKTWLENTPEQDLLRLLVPYPAQEMEAYPVSREVNNARIDTPELISRL